MSAYDMAVRIESGLLERGLKVTMVFSDPVDFERYKEEYGHSSRAVCPTSASGRFGRFRTDVTLVVGYYIALPSEYIPEGNNVIYVQ